MYQAILKLVPGDYENKDAIKNAIHYIYRWDSSSPLQVFCYNGLQYPPTCQTLIQDFDKVHGMADPVPSRQLFHFILSFPPDIGLPDGCRFFIDQVAALYATEYLVCYAYHRKGRRHNNPHFHFLVSSVNYRTGQALSIEQLASYFSQVQKLAGDWGIGLTFINEELIHDV